MQKKILIVEDDAALLKVLLQKVKSLDYAVVGAGDGAEALIKFKEESPDLVLLDVVMPIKNGFEVLEEIKVKQKSKVPVIILTNLAEYENIDRGRRLGAADYITKSDFTLKEIMLKMERAMEIDEQQKLN